MNLSRSRLLRWLRSAVVILVLAVVTAFVVNGLLSGTAAPEFGRVDAVPMVDESDRCSVLALNLAKAGFHRGGLSFRSTEDVRARLDDVAEALRSSGADLAVLSEVVFEAGPCPINQVEYLAKVGGFSSWAVRNDSVDLANNARQVVEILEYAANRETLLAGDFNAAPDWPPMQLIHSCGRFLDVFDSTPTFPSNAPQRRIDYIFAPCSWTRTAETVMRRVPSDHLPVHAVFSVPAQ